MNSQSQREINALPQSAPQTTAAQPTSPVQRVAIILTRLDNGGKERVAANLAFGLKQQGLSPLVVCFEEGGFLIQQLIRQGIETLVIPSGRKWDLRAVITLTRALRRHRSQILHVHDLQSLAYACLANHFAGNRPIVMTGHGLLFGTRRKPSLRERLMTRQIRLLSAVSPAAVEEYRSLLEYTEEVRLIQNGVPADRLPPHERAQRRSATRRSLQLHDNELLALAVGNIKPEKGFEDLLTAAEMLKDRPEGRRLRFCIAGDMPGDDYQRRLLAQHQAAGLQQNVRFLGPRDDVGDLYLAADIFVISSRKEALPMVLLEAMAAELPVVATTVGGIPEVLDGGRYGLMASPQEPAELAEQIALLVRNENIRSAFAAAARQRLVSTYSTEIMTRNYIAAYAAALDAAKVGRRKVPNVLMLGPMAPLSGGMATVMSGMDSGVISRSCRLKLLQSGKRTPDGRSFLRGFISQLQLAAHTAWLALTRRHCVVHIHTCSGFTFWRDGILALICRTLLKPVVLHIHGGRFDEFLAGLSPMRRRLARLLLCCPSRVLVLTSGWRDRLAEFCPGSRLQVMKNGVKIHPSLPPGIVCDLPDDQPDGNSLPAVRLLYMGNLGPRKGAAELIEALGLIAADYPQLHALIAGGETAPGQRADLQRRIDRLGLADRVTLAGVIADRQRDSAFTSADFLALPSHAEGLPMAILEAMSHGLPVIATRVGGIPETIEDGIDGLLVEPHDIPALAAAIGKLASSPVLRRNMSATARRKCQQHYSLEAVGAQMVGLYDSLINGEGRK